MSQLTWLPYDVNAWSQRTRELRLSLEAEGALMRMVREAWAADPPCTIVDEPDELARILGAQWKRGRELLGDIFMPDPEYPGRLTCVWLRELYDRQFAKHESYAKRGRKGADAGGRHAPLTIDGTMPCPVCGGATWDNRQKKRNPREPDYRCKAGPRRKGLQGCPGVVWPTGATQQQKAEPNADVAQQKAEPNALSRERREQNSAEVFSCAPTEHTTKNPTPASALALEDARASDTAPASDGRDAVQTSADVLGKLLTVIDPAQTARRNGAMSAVGAAAAANDWYAVHPELHDTIAERVAEQCAAFGADSARKRARILASVVHAEWQTATGTTPDPVCRVDRT